MKIAFYYECGKIPEIGMGHKYRSHEIGNELIRRGHKVEYTSNDVVKNGWDVLIIDHISSQKSIIDRAKASGAKVVLIDGAQEDVPLVDISISAFVNEESHYKGEKFLVFPANAWNRYSPRTKSKTIFVAVGGFDAGNIAEFILETLEEMGLNAIVAKSINHPDFKEKFGRVGIFEEDNYYDAMSECVLSITNGGLTFFQSLFYGMPTIPIPQYEHQKINIGYLEHCCLPVKKDTEDLKTKVGWLMENEYYRESLSRLSRFHVDGKGAKRICNLIEEL